MPQVFGWQHLVYLVLSVIVSAGGLAAIKIYVKSERTLAVITKCLGAALIVFVVLNRIFLQFDKSDIRFLLPDTLCGTTNILFGIFALFCKKNALPFHCVIYIAFFGGLANVIYPYYLPDYDSFLHPSTITSLLHHSIALFLAVMLVITGEFKPCLKKLYALPVGLCFMVSYGAILIDGLNMESAININSPLVPGTILHWFFVFPAMVLAVYGGVALYEKVIKVKLGERAKVKKAENDISSN